MTERSSLRTPVKGSTGTSLDTSKIHAILSKVDEADSMTEHEAKGKDLVLVVGNTGAGKSTFLNYLIGKRMIEERVQGSMKKGFRCDDPEFEIGFGFDSKTEFPQVFYDCASGLTFCDCPGFNDNRGVDFDISNMYAIARLVGSARSIKGVVVLVNYFSLEADRARGIRETLDILRKLFGESLPRCVSGVQIVVTRENGEVGLKSLREFLCEGASALNLPMALAENAVFYDPLDRFLAAPLSRVPRHAMISKLQRFNGVDKAHVNVVLPNDSKLALYENLSILMEKCRRHVKNEEFQFAAQFLSILEKLKILRVSEIDQVDQEFKLFCIQEAKVLATKDENLRLLQDLKIELPWIEEIIDEEIKGLVSRVEEKKRLNQRVSVAEEDLDLARKELRERELAHNKTMATLKEQKEEIELEMQRLRQDSARLREEQQRARSESSSITGNLLKMVIEALVARSPQPMIQQSPMNSPMPMGGGLGGLDQAFGAMSLGSPSAGRMPSMRSPSGGPRISGAPPPGMHWVAGHTRANGTQVQPYLRHNRK